MKKLFSLVCGLGVFVLSAGAASSPLPKTHATPLPNDPLKVTVHRLDNGLTVYLSENHQTPRITANIVIRAGGRHDPQDSTGMAHYLEHMLFKGSQKLGTLDWDAEAPHLKKIRDLYEKLFTVDDAEERSRILEQIDEANRRAAEYAIPNELDKLYKTLGFRGVNAYTANERTVCTVDFPKNRAETWAAIEADRFLHPVFRLFQSELETVYEEKNRAMDNPQRVLYRAYTSAMYRDHPYSVPILGTIEHLKNPSLEKMYAFYERHYHPQNMAIALSGDFDSGEMLEIVRRHFSVWQPKAVANPGEAELAPLKGVKRVEVVYEAEESLIMGWRTVSKNHPDRHALILMDMLVDNSVAGILNLHLNQAQKVKASGSYPGFKNEAGSWQMWGQPKDGQTLQEVEALLLEVVAKLKAGAFDQADIDAIITDMEVSQKRGWESNGSRVGQMAEAFASYEEWEDAVAYLERMKTLKKDDVLRVAQTYLTDNRVVVTRVNGKPEIPSIAKIEFTKIPIDPARQSTFFEELVVMPAEEIEPKWIEEGRDYEVRKGNWGRLVAVKNPLHDLFSLSFAVDVGTRHKRELAYASRLWGLAGAGEKSASEFKKALYALGSDMSFWVGEQTSGVTVSGLEKNYDRTLALLRERFASPNLAPDDLEKMIAVELGRRKDAKTNPGTQQGALRQWAMRGGESSLLNDLSNDELKRLDMDRLKNMLSEMLTYRTDIAYSGLRDADAVVDSIVASGMSYRRGFKYRPIRYVKPRRGRVLFLHRDMVQSKVGMFTQDEKWDPDHWVDYTFLSQYLGGGMSSILFQEVRESRSLAYAVGGGYRAGQRKGDRNILTGGLGTQADKTVEAAALVRELLAHTPSDEGRFMRVKQSIEQQFRTSPLTYSQIPGAVYHWDKAGIRGGDPRPARMEAVREYTLADMQSFARRFKDRDWTIYILGNKDRVDFDGLGELGEVELLDLDSLYPY